MVYLGLAHYTTPRHMTPHRSAAYTSKTRHPRRTPVTSSFPLRSSDSVETPKRDGHLENNCKLCTGTKQDFRISPRRRRRFGYTMTMQGPFYSPYTHAL